jgi:Transglycosylase SLT domain
MVNVPGAYSQLVQEMSQATGLPVAVIAAQANDESGFRSTAVSSTGAEGWLQFEPSTYDSYAAQAGVASGTEFNPADEAKVYDVFMTALLHQEKGNVRNALAAYNAGPGDIPAGLGYADKILGEAGQGGNITTTAASGNPITSLLGGGLSISGILSNLLGDLRDTFERFGLILLGGALILLGIHLLASGSAAQTTTNVYEASKTAKEKAPSRSVGGAAKSVEGTGAKAAVEAAAVA